MSGCTVQTIRAVVIALTGVLAGCAAGNSGVENAFAQMGAGPTVAFESVDGPPPHVFDRLVGVLDSESRLRRIPVVSREAAATYRVRSYLAAHIRGGRTAIAWTWDVYDRNQQRALRLSGEEPGGRSGRDAWASADDLVLRRIAQAGLTGLAAIVTGAGPAAPQAPSQTGPVLADAEDALRSTPSSADVSVGFIAR